MCFACILPASHNGTCPKWCIMKKCTVYVGTIVLCSHHIGYTLLYSSIYSKATLQVLYSPKWDYIQLQVTTGGTTMLQVTTGYYRCTHLVFAASTTYPMTWRPLDTCYRHTKHVVINEFIKIKIMSCFICITTCQPQVYWLSHLQY